jgi:hypothetical protein
MGRLAGILLICAGIWIGLEIYLEGTQNAFGGAFSAGPGEPEPVRERRTTPQRAGDAVRNALAREAEQRDRLMPD